MSARAFREDAKSVLRRAVLIAGPTASGKSALALDRAARTGAVVINADAMQVYDTLRVVTARPSIADEAAAEHRLYGSVPASTRFSTGEWVRAVESELASIDPDREVIFVGGTGLYFQTLTDGFADVPAVPDEIAAQVQQEIQALDEPERMARLLAADPEMARRIKVADPQRVMRAIAVHRATGRSLSSFQEGQRPGILEGWSVDRLVLAPERALLRDRIARRFEAMFAGGAVAEVEALLAQGLDPSLPAMKAIGVPEITAWLEGKLSRDKALELAITATRQYAKRQETWFRNRMGDWPRRVP